MALLEMEKKALLAIARKTIEARLTGKPNPEFRLGSEVLKEKKGAFVTLKKHDSLRGCIGYIEARKPLYQTVEEMALAAAFDDPRFPPLKPDEFKNVAIEISILSPLKRIRDINEIEVGIHGLYITKGFYSGLLLPQVATEYGWDRLVFLQETCHKAGLLRDAWKEKDANVYIFSAEVIGEHQSMV
ncbi:MAG TPA: AmmeMemoRadiSam system protein A [Syntrophales bacterium]|nr:AmmeMemoRadiSam system protein A [Syntrophales bacterium]